MTRNLRHFQRIAGLKLYRQVTPLTTSSDLAAATLARDVRGLML